MEVAGAAEVADIAAEERDGVELEKGDRIIDDAEYKEEKGSFSSLFLLSFFSSNADGEKEVDMLEEEDRCCCCS